MVNWYSGCRGGDTLTYHVHTHVAYVVVFTFSKLHSPSIIQSFHLTWETLLNIVIDACFFSKPMFYILINSSVLVRLEMNCLGFPVFQNYL